MRSTTVNGRLLRTYDWALSTEADFGRGPSYVVDILRVGWVELPIEKERIEVSFLNCLDRVSIFASLKIWPRETSLLPSGRVLANMAKITMSGKISVDRIIVSWFQIGV